MVGRGFTEADDREGAPGTIVLSYRLWQTEFGGDPAIIGRPLSAQADFDTAVFTVIGVMPREFRFPNAKIEFWITNRFGATQYTEEERTDNWLDGVGRLKRGVTLSQVRAEMDLIAAQLEKAYPVANKGTGAVIDPLSDDVSERSRLLLVALSGASACVLLIACANLANLLLTRALARRRELAVRTAIGAGRERLVRQLMTESLLLAVVGGALGIGIAVGAVPLLAQLVPSNLPTAAAPSVDTRVLLFAVALTVITGLSFGMAPVLRAGRSPDLDGLRDGARAGDGRKERLRSIFVVSEIVASIVLLVSAGLLIRALLTVRAIDPGFNAEGVLTMRTELPMPEFHKTVVDVRRTTRACLTASARCRRDVGGVRQLSPNLVVPRWDLAGFRQATRRSGHRRAHGEQFRGDPLRHTRLLSRDEHAAQARTGHRVRRHARPAVRCGGQRIVREALFSRPGSDRPPLYVRLRGPRDRRRGR
jgi:putative ABC transport system permease protein